MQIKNLTMSFGTQVIFNNVSLSIPYNEKIGVVGLNGAGKTTLFKIIMGLENADSGKILLKNNYRVDWLPQVISDNIANMEMSVFDYLISARPINELSSRLQDLYEKLADPNCNQKVIFNEIDKIQKKLEYWDYYNADVVLLKIIDGVGIDKTISKGSCGSSRKITVFPDGKVYACQAMEKVQQNYMHTINNDYLSSPNWDCWRSRSRFDNPECLSCGSVISCGGGCATGSYNINGSIYDIDKNNCEYTKKLFKKIHHI